MRFGFKFGLLRKDLGAPVVPSTNVCIVVGEDGVNKIYGWDALATPVLGATNTPTVDGSDFVTFTWELVQGIFLLRFGIAGDEQIFNTTERINIEGLGTAPMQEAQWDDVNLYYTFKNLGLAVELRDNFNGAQLCFTLAENPIPLNALVDEYGNYLLDANGNYLTS